MNFILSSLSMTQHIKSCGYLVKIRILSETESNIIDRHTALQINNIDAIISHSNCSIKDKLFYNILKSCGDQSLGESLFNNANIYRDKSMNIKMIYQEYNKFLWTRVSRFTCHHEVLNLTEMFLPSFFTFMNIFSNVTIP